MNLRLGQRLCHVEWAHGQPWIRIGIVTKVTKTTYHVDGRPAQEWSSTPVAAIRMEIYAIFREYGGIFPVRSADERADAVECLCRLRRLARRLRIDL